MTCQNDTVVLRVSIWSALLGSILGLGACSGAMSPASLSDRLPAGEAWHVRTFDTAVGPLRGAARAGEGEVVSFYIEGDGRAYLSSGIVSGDPTPGKPVGLDLAKADSSGGDVVYLARPCQYVGPPMPQACLRRDLYTRERWSTPVVDAYTRLIAAEANGRPVVLAGFSGGAYLALAVASRLPEGQVRDVRTYGGNLLPNHTQAYHRAERLEVVALDWATLARIPMVHYVGRNDRVIPADTQAAVEAQVGHAPPAWRWVSLDATHLEGWIR